MHTPKIVRLLLAAEHLLNLSLAAEFDPDATRNKENASRLLNLAMLSLRELDTDWDKAKKTDLAEATARVNAAKAGWARFNKGKSADPDAAAAKRKATTQFVSDVKDSWNALAPYHGFALINKATSARRSRILMMRSQYPDMAQWRAAIELYMGDVERWPERRNFGIDTFLRPTKFEQWFDAPSPMSKAPKDMTQEEADRWYGQGL